MRPPVFPNQKSGGINGHKMSPSYEGAYLTRPSASAIIQDIPSLNAALLAGVCNRG